MGMIQPSREPYNPADDLRQAGTFVCICTDVIQDIPSKKYQGKYDIVMQFTVADPSHERLRGKKTAIVCPQSIYRSKKDGKKSMLLQYMEQAGVAEAEKGCDPATLLDHAFFVRTELYDGKAYVRGLMPAPLSATKTASPKDMPADVPVTEKTDEQIPF